MSSPAVLRAVEQPTPKRSASCPVFKTRTPVNPKVIELAKQVLAGEVVQIAVVNRNVMDFSNAPKQYVELVAHLRKNNVHFLESYTWMPRYNNTSFSLHAFTITLAGQKDEDGC
ncbi:MAG: hypothetical protein JSR37_06060 [Verrucomicrobia bacterium]|nr:hypothetical protein [Verrucomicrobiota bacterium]MBS0636057.1 hypothetical protein [Verrucomicrobiota bacterium]